MKFKNINGDIVVIEHWDVSDFPHHDMDEKEQTYWDRIRKHFNDNPECPELSGELLIKVLSGEFDELHK